ncbi:DNA segregation ATPase FtsK/SpoIIIE, S-DNA-T family [Alkalithermobacter thermoalcaliphilus JW-YL-7 = DSM 7308]|uniref:Cell division FtsK/SpoIIIE n=1 Tax=Alkalithermobacter thermoalcaliphilus JW-YL-7 = DSM 7308 TaxID=1121328 RepID=A0A150FQE4_CLOPD|nr:cell division FtsK/SpoIIIE [[Clostridium] paradoxum JW-YL-7 = DSM 7308]SHK59182.1 DNA segregation ATPase FtsK/SpoIIIE, S-DNA-T family [[Clostridium] paradoxum JW-YL-7 = DSM 7308]
MKRKKNKKEIYKEEKQAIKLDESFREELYSIGLIFSGLFLSFSLTTKSMGKIGEFIRVIFLGFFSNVSIVFPYIIICIGVINLFQFEKLKKFIKYKLSNLFIFIVMLLYGISNHDFIPQDSPFLPQNLRIIFRMGVEGKGSGIFSTIIAYYFIKLFGIVGSYILSIFLTIILVIFGFNISLKDMCKNTIDFILRIFIDMKKLILDLIMVEEKDKKTKRLKKNTEKMEYKSHEHIENNEIKIVDFNNNLYEESKETNQEKLQLENTDEKHMNIAISNCDDNYLDYLIPSIDLLNKPNILGDQKDKKQILKNAKLLEKTLRDFGVEVSINQVTKGPTITRYEVQPKSGVKVSRIVSLTDDIALSLAAKSIRIEAPIPGKSAIGIEVPNEEIQLVTLREVIESKEFAESKSKLSFAIGKDISGTPIVSDISKMPHLLIAGATGSGKSVCVNTLITSILYKSKPDEVKFLMIDPKVVELGNYNGIPHLLIPVVTDPKKAASALSWAVNEMERRYKLFAENSVRDIYGYNEKSHEKLPSIVIIIDELADLMMVSANEVEDAICRLAQMARAAGMHLIVATQRPSVDVITGVIKANIPSRIAFSVSSQTDSRTILDMGGAEKLLGKGDMLFYPIGAAKPIRLQGAFVSEREVEDIVKYIKEQVCNQTFYKEDLLQNISKNISIETTSEDDLIDEAIQFIISSQQASTSMLQRKFRIGYNRAARLMDEMESRGIVGPNEGSKPRKVLINKEQYTAATSDK